MASTFAHDLAVIRSDLPEPDFTPDAFAEQPRSEDPPILAWSDPEPEPTVFPASVETRPDAVTQGPAIAARVGRLSAAVRLTREALSAWALLIEGPSEILTDSR
jgi:hypothetical protein